MYFKEKNILVVGASSGIGHELATQLLEQEAVLYTLSRRKPVLSGNFTHIEADILQLDNALDALPDRLDGIVYCPGSIHLKPFTALDIDFFRKELEINALGAVTVLKSCYKRLRKANESSVVLFSTVAVGLGMPYH